MAGSIDRYGALPNQYSNDPGQAASHQPAGGVQQQPPQWQQNYPAAMPAARQQQPGPRPATMQPRQNLPRLQTAGPPPGMHMPPNMYTPPSSASSAQATFGFGQAPMQVPYGQPHYAQQHAPHARPQQFYPQPQPVYAQPQPQYVQPQPPFHQPAAGYGAHHPAAQQPSPFQPPPWQAQAPNQLPQAHWQAAMPQGAPRAWSPPMNQPQQWFAETPQASPTSANFPAAAWAQPSRQPAPGQAPVRQHSMPLPNPMPGPDPSFAAPAFAQPHRRNTDPGGVRPAFGGPLSSDANQFASFSETTARPEGLSAQRRARQAEIERGHTTPREPRRMGPIQTGPAEAAIWNNMGDMPLKRTGARIQRQPVDRRGPSDATAVPSWQAGPLDWHGEAAAPDALSETRRRRQSEIEGGGSSTPVAAAGSGDGQVHDASAVNWNLVDSFLTEDHLSIKDTLMFSDIAPGSKAEEALRQRAAAFGITPEIDAHRATSVRPEVPPEV